MDGKVVRATMPALRAIATKVIGFAVYDHARAMKNPDGMIWGDEKSSVVIRETEDFYGSELYGMWADLADERVLRLAREELG